MCSIAVAASAHRDDIPRAPLVCQHGLSQFVEASRPCVSVERTWRKCPIARSCRGQRSLKSFQDIGCAGERRQPGCCCVRQPFMSTDDQASVWPQPRGEPFQDLALQPWRKIRESQIAAQNEIETAWDSVGAHIVMHERDVAVMPFEDTEGVINFFETPRDQ